MSLLENINPVVLVLSNANKVTMMLNQEEIQQYGENHETLHETNQVQDIVNFLQDFKAVGEQLSSKKYVTISCIIPTYDYLLKHVINRDSKDSPMIREMKTQMRAKLEK